MTTTKRRHTGGPNAMDGVSTSATRASSNGTTEDDGDAIASPASPSVPTPSASTTPPIELPAAANTLKEEG